MYTGADTITAVDEASLLQFDLAIYLNGASSSVMHLRHARHVARP
jgi:hypothetical protein